MEAPKFKPQEHKAQKKTKLPTPDELISHYESRGLDHRAAAVKVVGDLQTAVIRLASAGKKDRDLAAASRKIEALASRLAVVDAKLDSKPGFAEAFAVGIASGVAVSGISGVLPHLAAAAGEVWSSARSVFKQQ